MKHAFLAAVLTVSLLTSCGGSDNPELPTFAHAVKGDRVDPDSFLGALRHSFRAGSTAAISLDVRGGAAIRGSGTVRYTADRMDVNLRINDWKVPDASIDLRTVDGTTYMRVVESRGLWVNLDDAGAELPGADLAEDADPRRAIKDLRATISEVRFSGTETIGATRARRFQVVTTAKESAKPTVTQYWFDGRDRIIRRQSDLDPTGSATFTWSRWGQPVAIDRPASNTVVTLKELERLRREQAGSSGP